MHELGQERLWQIKLHGHEVAEGKVPTTDNGKHAMERAQEGPGSAAWQRAKRLAAEVAARRQKGRR